MRYYIYLDKCFLRRLFSVLGESNFDIEVVEYSVRKSSTVNNQIEVDPYTENFCEHEKDRTKEENKSLQKRYKDSKFKKQGVRGNLGYGNSSTIETQRRYINIEDITDMKNATFYHNLVKKLDIDNREDNRIIVESGYIKLYNRNNKFQEENNDNGFFLLNDKHIWFDKKLLQGDISLLAQMSCKIKLIGYTISCLEKKDKVIKAIAIYIE